MFEQQFTGKLETERRRLLKQKEEAEGILRLQIEDLNEGNTSLRNEYASLQRENDSLRRREDEQQSELEGVRRENDKMLESKMELIKNCSMEIDCLRHRIRMYTMGDWGGVISKRSGRGGF